ncbi:cytochrome c maturation protein CcmE [Hydrogenophaga sp. RWCD_12]|uniref:cytochrome c maturation protein CcmE n=1 Tax=Hydrogenophaga sp. RWCD_12 TaxID=3391190 RepID=UPI003984A5A3
MTPRRKRLVFAGLLVAFCAIAVGLVLNAFRSNVVFFFSPSDVVANKAPQERLFRMGGLVENGSVQRQANGVTVRFAVTDTVQRVPVEYTGILPDLFREGKGVVTQGRLSSNGVFRAQEVLAKHDENYMPPEAATALERAQKAQTSAAQTLQPAGK